MSYRHNPGLKAALVKAMSTKLDVAAEVGAERYREAVKLGPRTGEPIPGLGRNASNPDVPEPLQERTGDHHGAVKALPTDDPLRKVFGAVGVPGMSDEALEALEYGSTDGTLEGRFSLTNVAEDPDTHREMRRRM